MIDMAHGKHRRTKRTSSNDLRPRPAAERSMLRDTAAEFITQEHMVHDGDSQDRTELRFRLLACEHPGLCACADEYPNWKPGQR